jgi:hypothetical protein
MKTKLLGVAAACALALTVSTANATTYTIDGGDFTAARSTCELPPKVGNCSYYLVRSGDLGGTIAGTVEIDSGILTSADITVVDVIPMASFQFSVS